MANPRSKPTGPQASALRYFLRRGAKLPSDAVIRRCVDAGWLTHEWIRLPTGRSVPRHEVTDSGRDALEAYEKGASR